jgi:soluble lytic murein transglycosylase
MQLMPATAQEQARRDGRSYAFSSLTGDPDYNVRLGSSYFRDMVDYWDGSVVLAVASYNAGPGNVRRWVREYGDPRDANIDVVRWIEEIPFYETKTYVRNVLSNMIVYEQLAPEYVRGGPTDMRLTWHLGRGTRG